MKLVSYFWILVRYILWHFELLYFFVCTNHLIEVPITYRTLLGPPDPPEIINNETELSGRNVTAMWKKPSDNNCFITMYTLHYRIVGPTIKVENWSTVIINIEPYQPLPGSTSYELQLQYSKDYELFVSAWNKLGSSNSTVWHLRTAQGRGLLTRFFCYWLDPVAPCELDDWLLTSQIPFKILAKRQFNSDCGYFFFSNFIKILIPCF